MTVNEFVETASKIIAKGWIIAALTDDYIVDRWPLEERNMTNKEENVLEIRIFNETGECKLSRSDIGKEFAFRSIKDVLDKDSQVTTSWVTYGEDDPQELKYGFDEVQYLDVDEDKTINEREKKKIDGYEVYTTGGGKYKLPLEKIEDAKLRIRYYLGKYKATGQTRIEDWRVVEFEEDR